MFKVIRKVLGNRHGFTLIELMVVVVIISILAAITVPRFTEQAEKAKMSKAMADLKTLGTAIEMYYIDNNSVLPEDLDDLVSEGYLRSIPKSPWDTEYCYTKISRDKIPFTLFTTDKKDNNFYYPEAL